MGRNRTYNNRRSAPELISYGSYALQHDLLSKEDEAAIGQRILDGDQSAVNELVEGNLKFVVSIASKMRYIALPIQDRVQEGNMGLMYAASKFNYKLGFRFISYATWWVRQYIQKAGRHQSKVVYVPMGTSPLLKIAKDIMDDYFCKNQIEMPRDLLMAVVGVSEAVADALLVTRNVTKSLDSPVGGAEKKTVVDIIEDNGRAADANLGRTVAAMIIDNHELCADSRGLDIVKMRFGIGGYNGECTLDECAVKYGISRERARQLQEAEFISFRKSIRRKRLMQQSKEIIKEANDNGLIIEREES